jgi:pimeloyl-ACP methyl ester carboxylesterase
MSRNGIVVVGEHDPSTPPARGKEIVSPLPSAKLVARDAGHLSPVEMLDAFAASLREFIGRAVRV